MTIHMHVHLGERSFSYMFFGWNYKEISLAIVHSCLEANNGNRSQTARDLGICIRSMRNKLQKMKKYGMEIPEYIPPKAKKKKKRKRYLSKRDGL